MYRNFGRNVSQMLTPVDHESGSEKSLQSQRPSRLPILINWSAKFEPRHLVGKVCTIKLRDQTLSDTLHSAIEQFWEVQQPARIDLMPLWASISWATSEDMLPSSDSPRGGWHNGLTRRRSFANCRITVSALMNHLRGAVT